MEIVPVFKFQHIEYELITTCQYLGRHQLLGQYATYSKGNKMKTKLIKLAFYHKRFLINDFLFI